MHRRPHVVHVNPEIMSPKLQNGNGGTERLKSRSVGDGALVLNCLEQTTMAGIIATRK